MKTREQSHRIYFTFFSSVSLICQSVLISNIIGYIESFIPKPLSFQLFHAELRLQLFALISSVLGLRLNGRRDIHSIKSAFCMQSLKPTSQPLYMEIIKGLRQKHISPHQNKKANVSECKTPIGCLTFVFHQKYFL